MAGIKWAAIGEQTVTTAATAVRITATPTYTPAFQVQAAEGNSTNLIYLGLSDVSATNYLVALGAGEVWSTSNSEMKDQEYDLSDYYICASANTQKASASYLKKR